MKKMVLVGLISWIGLSASLADAASSLRFAQLPKALAQIQRNCTEVDGNDVFACPVLRAYVSKDKARLTSSNGIEDLFNQIRKSYSFKVVKPNVGAAHLVERIRSQARGIEDASQRSRALAVAAMIETYILGWEQTVVLDDDTYWAPSVNSSVLVLANPETGLVIQIEHGDTDG